MARDEFLEEACTIGDDLVKRAVISSGRASWIGRALPEVYDPIHPKPIARSTGPRLFDGNAGLALFLAHLGRMSGEARHTEVARGAAWQSVHQALADPNLLTDPGRYGLYSGGLGVAWTTFEVAQATDDERLKEASLGILERVMSAPMKGGFNDIIVGYAGGVLAALDLHRRGVKEAGAFARSLAEQLVATAERTREGTSWVGVSSGWPKHLTGFSHGTAGIAWSLGAAFAELGGDAFREACEGGIAYERTHFDAGTGNWPDFRFGHGEGAQRVSTVWCHGAPGIGLSRTLLYPLLKDEALLEEARVATETTASELKSVLDKPGWNFMLCHGVAGLAETQWLTLDGLGLDGRQVAEDVARYGIKRYGAGARERWGSQMVDWPTGMTGARELSMMKGITGIGYFLLRLSDPATVPSLIAPGSWSSDRFPRINA